MSNANRRRKRSAARLADTVQECLDVAGEVGSERTRTEMGKLREPAESNARRSAPGQPRRSRPRPPRRVPSAARHRRYRSCPPRYASRGNARGLPLRRSTCLVSVPERGRIRAPRLPASHRPQAARSLPPSRRPPFPDRPRHTIRFAERCGVRLLPLGPAPDRGVHLLVRPLAVRNGGAAVRWHRPAPQPPNWLGCLQRELHASSLRKDGVLNYLCI